MVSPARVAYSPAEFAKLFGKSQTWGYRQIYAGKVNAITKHGRILIPAKDVERILESAGIYNGKEKPKAAVARIKNLTPEQKDIWYRFIESRRQSGTGSAPIRTESGTAPPMSASPPRSRATVLKRLAKSWKGKASSATRTISKRQG